MKDSDTLQSRRQWLHGSATLAAAAACAVWPLSAVAQVAPFDHGHSAWTALLKKHVVLMQQARASQLRYAGMAVDRSTLKAYLASVAAVTPAAFQGFSRTQQMAFLINAYNAATVELVLTRYPDLASIKDVTGLFGNPWKQKIVPLLGTTMTLDQIEHETLRARGRYDDPRIHFAVNCASVGCPMLREEAYVAERLDAQLEEQARRFMSDRSRNRWNAERQRLEVSKIFDWYGEDFRLGHQGIASLAAFMARHADVLADVPADRERIRAMKTDIAFLDYDWKLNDAR
jgi:Protein of unknown function, DUF547